MWNRYEAGVIYSFKVEQMVKKGKCDCLVYECFVIYWFIALNHACFSFTMLFIRPSCGPIVYVCVNAAGVPIRTQLDK